MGKRSFTDTNLKNELNRLLAWCIEDEESVRFKPFVAGVLSAGYIYKNAGFSQSVAKHMFQMRKGDFDPFTATYMENLLAVGFHKLGGQDAGFNKLLTFQNKLTPEGKRALLSEYKCPSVSDFNEEVNMDELPRGSICQWRYASMDKINSGSLQFLTVDVVGYSMEALLNRTPGAVGKQFLVILENERFWRADGFKYFEILNKNTLIPVVEVKSSAAGRNVMPFTEWVMRRKNVDEIVFELSELGRLSDFSRTETSLIKDGKAVGMIQSLRNGGWRVTLREVLGVNKPILDSWITEIRRNPGFGRVKGVNSNGKAMNKMSFDEGTIYARDIVSQLNTGETGRKSLAVAIMANGSC